MLSSRPTINDTYKDFEVFKNLSGETLVRGAPVVFMGGTDKAGNGVTLPASATMGLFAGIVESDILDQKFGRVLVSGVCDFARVQAGPSQINKGDVLRPSTSGQYLQRSGPSDEFSAFVHAFEDIAPSIPETIVIRRVLVRAR